MSHTRLTTPPTTRFHRLVARTTLALGGLLLTGACGTVHAGAAHDAVGAAGPAVASPSRAAPTPAASAGAPAPAPAPRSSRVRTPLALPVTAASTAGAITGTVSSGKLGCLFVRTDAGQVFSVAGGQRQRLRQLLPAASLTTSSTGVVTTPNVVAGSAGSSGPSESLRISAAGTVRAAPSFCGASYTFTIATVRVEGLPPR